MALKQDTPQTGTGRRRRRSVRPAPSVPPRTVPADGVAAWLERKSQRRSLGDFPAVAAGALGLVWGAARWRFVLASSFELLSAGLLGLQLLAGKVAIEAILAAQQGTVAMAGVVPPLLAIAAVTALLALVGALSGQLQRLVSEQVLRATWDQVLDVTSEVDLMTYEQPAFYEELHRVELSAIQRPLELARGLVSLLGGAFGVLVLGVVLVRISPLLPLVLLVGAPALWLVTRRRGRLEFAFVREQATAYRERNYLRAVLTDRQEAKEIRSFGLARTLRARYDDRYDRYVAGLRRLVRRQVRLSLVAAAVTTLVLTATLLLLVWLITSGRIELAEAAVAAVGVRLLSGRVTGLMSGVGQLYESTLFLQDLRDFTGRSVPPPAADAAPVVPPLERLTVSGVSMTYPAAAAPALTDVDLEIGPGEVVALVGENGSGKTTLAKLVAQLYIPDTGVVRWNGADTAGLDARSLRRQVAVIFQDYAQWELSGHDNIALGRPDGPPDRDAVRRAARRTGAEEFLDRLPEGFDTMLSTTYVGGAQLSVGQWQRLALARALYRDASLIVLDEPSAAMDPRAEADLFAHLREIAAGRSVLFISHRFSTVRSADRIYVLQQGRVVEHGDHDALMRLDGTYAELFRLQAAAYLDPEAPTGWSAN